ncbi:hypothetical protein ACH4D5_21160 [Streptomyces sp. NPDC018029]|uniref:hypothetical protein n=1 Tax=Streptomyces sp. NPDC018029 TaxID=3365032 RepID=UPI0037A2DD7C
MSVNRRRLLGGSLAAAVAGSLGPLAGQSHARAHVRPGTADGPATDAAGAQAAFDLALLDVNRDSVDIFSSGTQFTDADRKWGIQSRAGDVLECRPRVIPHENPGYPHCVEYLDGTGAFVVAGSRGVIHLFVSDGVHLRSIRQVGRPYPHPKAHSVLGDPTIQRLWAFGGKELVLYRVTGQYADTRLVRERTFWDRFENGHDLCSHNGLPASRWPGLSAGGARCGQPRRLRWRPHGHDRATDNGLRMRPPGRRTAPRFRRAVPGAGKRPAVSVSVAGTGRRRVQG